MKVGFWPTVTVRVAGAESPEGSTHVAEAAAPHATGRYVMQAYRLG